jgi:Na+/melibiose symporter-like transporter
MTIDNASRLQLCCYGALGLPLAFVALPLYVQLPAWYAEHYGVALGALGTLLLLARGLDALLDPWLGRRIDAGFAAGPARVRRWIGVAALLIGLGFAALFLVPGPIAAQGQTALLLWCGAMLLPTCLAYSVATVAHQAWGARLGGGAAQQARLAAWREGAGLAGVLLASVLPALAGLPATAGVLATGLLAGWWLLGRAPQQVDTTTAPVCGAVDAQPAPRPTASPWHEAAFRHLIGVHLLNGVAAAVPATLLLFFVRDRLQLASVWEAVFLGSYFMAGVLSLPLWVSVVARFGLVRAWGWGMTLAVLAFSGATLLGPGDARLFLTICIASGLALGADLAVPPALLAAVVQQAGGQGRAEGAYFGWWTAATKLNLALAAGLALPLLQLGGYQPGSRDPQALHTLTLAYALLPCVLKLLAWALLRHLPARLATAAPPPQQRHPAPTALPPTPIR